MKVSGRSAALVSLAGSLVLAASAGVSWRLDAAGQSLHPAKTASASDKRAGRMLDAAIIPPGAVQVPSLPGSVFAQPFQHPACTPLVDEARYWKVPGNPRNIASFLKVHAPSWIPNSGSGSGGPSGKPTFYGVFDVPRAKGWSSSAQLDFTVAALRGGATGIRADAEVIPPRSSCARSGGAAEPGNAPAHT